jgi:D-alanine-D-alanine ligase
MMKIPYTSCSAFCSALTFNKHACKLYLKEYGIPIADAILFRNNCSQDTAEITQKIGLPCFVKPNDSGSSFGVTKVKTKDDFLPAIQKALIESNEVLVESFVQGREVACGVVKTKAKSLVFPVTEIISKNEFFDYEAKYTPGKSDEVTPAKMPVQITSRIQSMSSKIYDLLGCKGIVRVDFIIKGNEPVFIEINTIPGMTEESIVPKQAEAASIPLKDLYTMVIEDLF